MLRSVVNQIAARMDAATATQPSMMVTQAILAKTRKGLVEHGEDVAQFHAEGFSTLLAWISKGIRRSPEDTATLESATWQELVREHPPRIERKKVRILQGCSPSMSALVLRCGIEAHVVAPLLIDVLVGAAAQQDFSDCIGGHGTDPYEQKTQQCPG